MASKRSVLLEYLEQTLFPQITTGNGFNLTLGLIDRGLRYVDQLTDDKFPALFIADTAENRSNISHKDYKAEMEVLLIGGVKSPDGVGGNQVALDLLIEDITKALETDRLQGNRVNQTEIKRVETDSGDSQAHAACYITVVFKYTGEASAP